MVRLSASYAARRLSRNYYRRTDGFPSVRTRNWSDFWDDLGFGFAGTTTLGTGITGAYLANMNKRKATNQAPSQYRKFFKGNPMGPKSVGGEDVQYIAAIRNTKSKYGKKRRKNLKNAWYELNRAKSMVWSRFQAFRQGGFAAGIGAIPTTYVDTGSFVGLPMFCFRLTAYPTAVQALSGSNQTLSPVCMYQLTRSPLGTTNAVYTWSPISGFLVNSETGDNNDSNRLNKINTWDVYRAEGKNIDLEANLDRTLIHSFRHEWTNYKLTFYPQTGLPTDWTVRIVKFKGDIPGYPQAEGKNPDGDRVPVYTPNAVAIGQRASAITMMWDSYFGGKILHPHNTQPVSTTEYGKLPFVPLKTEKFYVPAREQTTAEAPTRVLHSSFFRNDRQYKTLSAKDIQNFNTNTLGTFDFIDENQDFDIPDTSSPFPVPGEELWLMVEATGYKRFTTAQDPSAAVPTFDFCFRNCHSMTDRDFYGHQQQLFFDPVPPGIVETKPEVEPTIPIEPTETTEV